MGTGLNTYDNPTKDSWRGWLWNRIVERLPEFRGAMPSPGSARMRQVTSQKTVLYLAGPDDGDRPHALKRGFAHENLIALDRCRTVVNKVRGRGVVAINADLCDSVSHWPHDWTLDVIVADFTCGFGKTAESLLQALLSSAAVTDRTVIAINLLRGRDGISNEMREWLCDELLDETKNRAVLWLTALLWDCSWFLTNDGKSRGRKPDDLMLRRMSEHANADWLSYPSRYERSAHWFDSAVFVFPLKCHRSLPTSLVSRKITAARAVRTAKIRRRAAR